MQDSSSWLSKVDGREIDYEVAQHIDNVKNLLTKKQNMIKEERINVLKDLQQRREDLRRTKDRITKAILHEHEELKKQKESLTKYRRKFFESERPRDAIVTINVGGRRIDTQQGTLTNCHGSTLSAMFSLSEFPGPRDKDVAAFVDRNPKFFSKILEFLRANTQPWFESKAEEKAFRKEVDYFGLTSWIFPPRHTVPPISMRVSPDHVAKVYQVRCNPAEIKRDSWYSSPDFLHTQKGKESGDRWRLLFTERNSFLSVFAHNVDAGLMLANGEEKTFYLKFTLVHKDTPELNVSQRVRHTFTRRYADVGYNYFQLIQPLRALRQSGFIHSTQAAKKDDEPQHDIVFELEITDPDALDGQGAARPDAADSAALPGSPSPRRHQRRKSVGSPLRTLSPEAAG
eukprot:TRINITY_DN2787_c1_g1_i1.p1 TRINITY_DN2787_c1_g1~~TRINITY_DN2787_c1_g1_i1.p1  ORF type:complete len:400 (+),score=65.63 TRINITY_DN2787_c1_g1_i1:105-1304(+)